MAPISAPKKAKARTLFSAMAAEDSNTGTGTGMSTPNQVPTKAPAAATKSAPATAAWRKQAPASARKSIGKGSSPRDEAIAEGAAKLRKSITGDLMVVVPKAAATSPRVARGNGDSGEQVGNLSARKSRARAGDANLGAHYAPVSAWLLDNNEDAVRESHDAALADTLHKRRPSEQAMSNSPRVPMRSAFTDRANKMREGKGMKSTLMKDPHLSTEWAQHEDCDCLPCKPWAHRQAGNASHEVIHNKLVRCVKDSAPTQPPWEEPVTNTFKSDHARRIMRHPQEHKEPSLAGEIFFQQTIGRRVKEIPKPTSPGSTGVLMHRSMSADNLSAAGKYNKGYRPEIMAHTHKARQDFQGRAESPISPRSGIKMALSPRQGDPPAPSKIMVDKRGEGTFKSGPSPVSASHTVYYNPEVFRFSDPATVHGRNTPAPQYEKGCGLTTQGFHERFMRQQPTSPKTSPRALIGSNSASMSSIMNHDAGEQLFAKEASNRTRTDVAFNSLCNLTAEHLKTQRSIGSEIKKHCGRTQSTNVCQHLVWE
mmetsp:Transcript_59948/g.126917  ORF Transcript_59948/g.126917 Transcript_59948/m.126917 type:complete len:538 (-) Transcript_59948:109-1722(-)